MYRGIDAHKRYSQITVMKENGKLVERQRINNDRSSIEQALSPYANTGSNAVLESSGNRGLLHDMFSEYIDEVNVAHPLMTIPGIGKFFAMLLRHEIDKIGRFPTSDTLCSYAG